MSNEVIVFIEDECHVVWGDAIGYGWGRQNEQTVVPIENVKQRQTYYGVINLYNHEFILGPYERGKGANTVSFIEYLQGLHPDKKLIIMGDGASYHGSEAVQTYLNKVNHGLEEARLESDVLIICAQCTWSKSPLRYLATGKKFSATAFL